MTSETLYILGRIKMRIINAAEDIIIDEDNDWDYNATQEAIKEVYIKHCQLCRNIVIKEENKNDYIKSFKYRITICRF